MWLFLFFLVSFTAIRGHCCSGHSSKGAWNVEKDLFKKSNSLLFAPTVDNIPYSEMTALLDLYDATNGLHWRCCEDVGTVAWNFTNMNANPCVDNWQGITCSVISDQYFITELRLINFKMVGTMPESLQNLSALTMLNFIGNELNGTIPNSVGNLTNLQSFLLEGNLLTATIPNSLGYLLNLEHIFLGVNSFTGTIPMSLGNLVKLVGLFLYANSLTGTMPPSFGKLVKLESLSLEHNLLTGSLPSTLSNLTSLVGIYTYNNFLTGSIPNMLFSNMSNLASIFIDTNSLTGVVPASLSNASRLAYMYIHTNSLVGTIPSSFGQLINLDSLFIHSNSLTGTIPSSFGYLTEADSVYCNSNFLTGTIPSMVGRMWKVQELVVSDNLLSGGIPVTLSALSLLVTLEIDNNGLTGSLDGIFNASGQSQLNTIQLNSNQLTGMLPGDLFALPQLAVLVASVNCFHGSIPSSVCNSSHMVTLVLDGLSSAESCRDVIFPGYSPAYLLTKSVGGGVPSCLFQLPHIEVLQMSGNRFTGSLPSDLVISASLVNFTISHNDLTGHIVDSLQSKDWTLLDMSYNRLTGSLLTGFSVKNDTSLSLEVNRLSGGVPSSLLDVKSIDILESNLFSCNYAKTNLPKEDGARGQYSCGSNEFDIQYYIWLAIFFIVVGAVFCIWNRRKQYDGASSLHNHASSWLHHTNPNLLDHTKLATVSRMYSVVLDLVLYCALYIVVCLLPLYCLLSTYYGTYTHEYAYTASAAFLSGQVPFGLEFACWLLYLVFLLVWHTGGASGKDMQGMKHCGDGCVDDKEKRVSEPKLLWKIYVGVMFVVINLVVVIFINTGYVYVALYEKQIYLVGASIFVSIFKLSWNNVFSSQLLIYLLTDAHLDVAVEFDGLRRTMGIVNVVLIPLCVVVFISPNCIYNIIVPAPSVSSHYSILTCSVTGSGQCDSWTPTPESTSYDPPFTYNFQCSSTFITYYSPAFVIFCFISSFVVPAVKVAALHFHKYSHADSMCFQFLNKSIPLLLRPHVISDAEENGKEVYFKASSMLMTLTANLGLLVTFGVVVPPLGLAFTFSLVVIVYSSRLELGRFLEVTSARKLSNCARRIEDNCAVFGSLHLMDNIIWTLVTVSCLFYTLFLFDTLGDAVGFQRSYWVLVVVPLMPIVMYLLGFFLRWTFPQRSVNVGLRSFSKTGVEMENVRCGDPECSPETPMEHPDATFNPVLY